jgi:LuxR family maltose regulon positive regulatory protein
VEDEIGFSRELAHLILARALVALGRQAPKSGHLADAHRLLARLLDAAERMRWMGKAIEILVLQALAYQVQNDTGRALASLQRALTLAEPEGYARVFLDEGAPMVGLLQQAAGRGIAPAYVRKLLVASPDEGPRTFRAQTKDEAPSVLRPLSFVECPSEREMEVLTLLSDGLTNQEIATRLTLAVSTRTRIGSPFLACQL